MKMVSSGFLFFISSLIIHLVRIAIAQPNFVQYICSESGDYTSNRSYQANLNRLLSSLSSNTEIDYGFYSFSTGQNTSKVNAIALCRGDLTPGKCRSCVNDSSHELTHLCPYQKEAIGWYDRCMLRYSDRSIFGVLESRPLHLEANPNNASTVDEFNQVLETLFENLKTQAASGGSRKKFAAGVNSTSLQKIYAFVQCTPDLSELECRNCLDGAINMFPGGSDRKEGGRVFSPSCNVRFELFPVVDESTDNFLPSPTYIPAATTYSASATTYTPTATDNFLPSLTYIPPATTNTPPATDNITATKATDNFVPSPTYIPAANSSPPPLTNTTATKGKKSNKSRTVIIIVIIVVPTVTSVIIIACILIILRARKPREKNETMDEIKSADSLQFDFGTIRVATDDFSAANKLGQGGFGAVYKGRLSNGQDIAVKMLLMNSEQGEQEFKNEVLLVAKLQHKNLVRLLGFCLNGNERLLIYEFLPNTSLNHFIFDPEKCKELDWDKRANFVNGIVKGILYLHEDSRLKIIHRDLKASNVLLDDEMNPKISDFGTARIFGGQQIEANTNRIVGTFGYMAPEYAMEGLYSVKSDVYSFGVLLLEIISGRKNTGFDNSDHCLYAWKIWNEGKGEELIDRNLIDTCPLSEALRWIHIALLCIQEDPNDRPTMSTVVLMLGCKSAELPQPSAPPFTLGRIFMSDESSSSGTGTGFLTDQSSTNPSS